MDRSGSHNGSLDILCPRATIHWEECADWPGGPRLGIELTQAVLFRDKVYIGAKVQEHNRYHRGKLVGKVYCSNTDFTSWNSLSVPDVTGFALCTYQSQLVLAGGLNCTTEDVSKDLWTSDDGTDWKQSESLPPMPTACHRHAVVNTGNPEYLLVVGGYSNSQFTPLHKVAVLIEKQWFSLQPLPFPGYSTKFAFHNGNLYFIGSDSLRIFCTYYYCEMDLLMEACNLVRAGEKDSVLWKQLEMPEQLFSPVSFGQQLVARSRVRELGITEILAYSNSNQSWVQVGEFPKDLKPACMLVVPTGEMVAICKGSGPEAVRNKVLRASLRESSCHPDSNFSTSALLELEAIGIQVMTSLAEIPRQLAIAVRFSELVEDEHVFTRTGYLKTLIRFWLSGKGCRPPTWRSLYEVLREHDFEELYKEIEEYVTSMKTLKELSTSVIMSALLQQRSLRPDQLHARLPDYVPPTVIRYIATSLSSRQLHTVFSS